MAVTITHQATLAASGDGRSITRTSSGSATQSGTHSTGQIQAIGTTYEALALGADLATAGFAWFKNLDDTNYVELGVDVGGTFYPLVKLGPGNATVLRLATTSVYAQANTAEVALDFLVMEE